MARQAQLVCQHLENISHDALSKYQDVIRSYVRGRQGIYALYRKNELYYVGLAGNLRSRLKSHLRDRHRKLWDRFSVYLTIGDSHLKELESLILRTVKPSGNHQSGKFIKSENLRGRLSRELRDRQKQERDWVIGRSTSPIPKHRRQKVVQRGAPVLSAYINHSTKLRANFKNKIIRARVRRTGVVRYKNRDYNSPSFAAAAVVKRNCNGWTFWKYERAPGDWVFLDQLRR
jgi:Restriction Enzyme Adenine Methylase Associated